MKMLLACVHQRCFAIAIFLLALSRGAFASHSRFRAQHVHENLPKSVSVASLAYHLHDHDHDNSLDQGQDRHYVDKHSHIKHHVDKHIEHHVDKHVDKHTDLDKHAHLVVSSSAMNKSATAATMSVVEQMSEQDMEAITSSILYLKPEELQNKFMTKLHDMDQGEVMEKVGDKLPPEVAALVTATKSASTQPFTEAALTKARNVLNGMVESAQIELDAKMIQCKEFYDRNRGAWEQVKTDLSRFAANLAVFEKEQGESQSGIAQADADIIKVQEEMGAAETAYNKQLAADEAEMADLKADVAVAEFVLKFTKCKKGQALFVQQSSNISEPVDSLSFCKSEGNLEFHFEDPKLQAQASLSLTPQARVKLERYLSDLPEEPNNELSLTAIHDIPDADSDASVDGDIPSRSLSPSQASDSAQSHKLELKKVTPQAQVLAASTARAIETQPRDKLPGEDGGPGGDKCTLGKANCGLLHDNMSLMWGARKDLVDELQEAMDRKAAEFETLKKDFNEQIEILGTTKENFNVQLADCVGHKNSVTEESAAKMREERALDKEFKRVWGECKATIAEIMYTDICGVLMVRGSLAFYSKVKPKDIVDCAVSDFLPEMCTKKGVTITCDNSLVGGMQVLKREITQEPNKYGHKCPPLTNQRACGQTKCPVNCKFSSWSGWGKCTKECEGGIRGRTRTVVVKPKNGGEACGANQESEPCNVGSCDRDCTLKAWSTWSACSQACDAGYTERHRHIKRKVRANGKCPKEKSTMRYEKKKCNAVPCVGDEQCVAKMDLIVAIDGSGSLRKEGYEVLKKYTSALIKRMEGEAYGRKAVKVGVIQFGNGQIEKDGTISPGIDVAQLGFDMKKAAAKIEATEWLRGFTNLAQVFAQAEKMSMNGGRKHAVSKILIITDGKPSFKFSTSQEAKKIRSKGTEISMVNVNAKPDKQTEEWLLKSIVSQPGKMNYIRVPGLKMLKQEQDKWVAKALAHSCPKAISPSQMEATAQANGFRLVKEGVWCGEDPKKGEPMHKSISKEFMPGPAECMSLALEMEKQYFSFGTEVGYNAEASGRGQCYLEMTTDGEKCPEGWKKAPVNYYKVLETGIKVE